MARLINHSLINKAQFGFLILSFISLPFPIKYNRFAIVFLAIFTLLSIDFTKVKSNFYDRRVIFLPSLLLLLNVVGLLFSTNISEGLALIERTSILLILPVIFLSFDDISDNARNKILKIVTISYSAIAFYCLLNAFWNIFASGSIIDQSQITDRKYYLFLNKELTVSAINISPIYFGLYLNLCIGFLAHKMYILKRKDRLDKFLLIFLNLFQILVISISAIITLILIWLVILVKYLEVERKLKIRILILGIGLFGILSFLAVVYFVQPLHDRVFVNLDYKLSNEHISNWNGFTLRLAVWECAFEALRMSPVWGYGTGDANQVLWDLYQAKEFHIGKLMNLNSHNQYIQSYLMHGIFGLGILFYILGCLYFKSKMSGNLLQGIFILIMFTGFLSEVILSTQKGLVFFSLFTSLLFVSNDKS